MGEQSASGQLQDLLGRRQRVFSQRRARESVGTLGMGISFQRFTSHPRDLPVSSIYAILNANVAGLRSSSTTRNFWHVLARSKLIQSLLIQ